MSSACPEVRGRKAVKIRGENTGTLSGGINYFPAGEPIIGVARYEVASKRFGVTRVIIVRKALTTAMSHPHREPLLPD